MSDEATKTEQPVDQPAEQPEQQDNTQSFGLISDTISAPQLSQPSSVVSLSNVVFGMLGIAGIITAGILWYRRGQPKMVQGLAGEPDEADPYPDAIDAEYIEHQEGK